MNDQTPYAVTMPPKHANFVKLSAQTHVTDYFLSPKQPDGFGEKLTKTIEEQTGIETRFARLAHVVRGGSPTLRDRLLGSKVGAYAVEKLLNGESNLVICERKGEITAMDIGEALILDRMYKNKLKEGDLEKFSKEKVEWMREFCKNKFDSFKRLYDLAAEISK